MWSYLEQRWSLSKENECIPTSSLVLWYGHFSFCSSTAWFNNVLSLCGGSITDAGKNAEEKPNTEVTVSMQDQ